VGRQAFDERGQALCDLVRALRGQVEAQDLDGDSPSAGHILTAKDRTETARADLVQDAEAAEGRRNVER
jgi:hypothetical protein